MPQAGQAGGPGARGVLQGAAGGLRVGLRVRRVAPAAAGRGRRRQGGPGGPRRVQEQGPPRCQQQGRFTYLEGGKCV